MLKLVDKFFDFFRLDIDAEEAYLQEYHTQSERKEVQKLKTQTKMISNSILTYLLFLVILIALNYLLLPLILK